MKKPPVPGANFRDKVLGRWSSHPEWLEWRDRWLRGMALSAIGILWSMFVAQLKRVDIWLQHSPQITNRFIWIVVAGTAAIAALTSLSVCGRLSLKLYGPRLVGTSGLDRPRELAVLIVGLFFGLLAPLTAIYWLNVTPLKRLGLHLMGASPLVALLTVLRFRKPPLRSGYRLTRQPLWIGCAAILAAGAILGTLYDRGLLDWPPQLANAYRRFVTPYAALFWCAPMAVVAWVMWLTSWRLIPVQLRSTAPAKTFWGRLWNAIRNLFRGNVVDDTAVKNPPEWLSTFSAALPAGCKLLRGPVLESSQASSPLVDRSDIACFLGGLNPTADQASAFDQMARGFERVLAAVGDLGSRPDEELNSDFLILGDPGSGRTATLLAYAMFASLVRGQSTLLLTSTVRKANAVVDRLRQQLSTTGSDCFVSIRFVTEKDVTDVLADAPELPQIWIGTVDQVEQYLFGSIVRDQKSVSRLSRVLSLIDVIMVDDLLSMDDVHRMHLPYTIDKLRLLSEAGLLPVQVIMTSRPQSMQGARMLGEQMLGRGYRDEHILVLRPPYSEAGWRLDLSVSSQRETLHYLTTWCMQHGLDITVYCDALDAGMRDALKDRLLNASPKGRVTIIPDVDELPGGVLDADVVLYASNSNDHAAQELKSRARSKIPVIITVATGADKSQSAGILGIVLDRASPSFVAAHLRNVYRLLPDEAPIELDAWRRFGIRLEQLSGEALAGEVAVDIDRYEGSNEAIARSLWGMTCASPRQLSPYPVDVFFPAERELAVFATCDRSGFFMKSLPNTASRTGRAEWQLQNGQQLRQVDLVHETELLLRYDGNSYVPIHVDGEKRPVILTAGHFNGDESDDAFLPVVDLAFEVPTKVKQIAQAGGSANIGIYWCQLEVDPSPIMVDSGIVGRCSRAGIETPMTRVDFTYPAQLTAIIIRPCDWSAKQLDDLFSQTLQGKWSTNQENFDPVLTAAVASTFARTLVGVPRFARVIAARFNESDRKRIGEAVVWLIEALDTGRSASMAILEVLRDVKHREVILARIDRFTEIAEKDKSVQRLRAMSGLPTAGDARQHPTNISVANKQVS